MDAGGSKQSFRRVCCGRLSARPDVDTLAVSEYDLWTERALVRLRQARRVKERECPIGDFSRLS